MTMRCPICRSASFDLIETFEEFEYRAVKNGVVSGTADRWPGSLLSTRCACTECGHHWSPRQASLETLKRASDED